jgi:hypothetical protein
VWKRFEKRLDKEMRFHLDQLIQEYIAQGLTPEEARYRAQREFGSVELAKDEVRDLRPLEWVEQVSRDLGFAIRGALRTPGFSLAVIAVLALGIGPNTAIFSLVYATLFAPPPYPQPEQCIYRVMACAVAQRTPEIGLRMALGARQVEVRLQIIREGLTLAAGGLVLGLAGAYVLGRAMQSTLYGTTPLSLPVVLVVGLVLLGAALVACYIPARRASAVDPMIALRQE